MPGPLQQEILSAAPGEWRFSRADPDPDLRGRVREYWEVEGKLAAFREDLLPNGCLEIMFNLGPPHTLFTAGLPSVWTGAWFSGLQERALVIESLEGTHLVSARLTPLGAVELLGEAAPAAANRVVELEEFLGAPAADLGGRIRAAGDPAARFAVLEAFLRERQSQEGVECPAFVRACAERIEAAHGNLRVSALHEEAGISRKHLAVSFPRYMGITAKAYAQLRRFLWTLDRLRKSVEVDWSRLAGEAGYSDQSHLARDFRRIGAASPTEYLQRRTPDGAALLSEPVSDPG